MVELERVLLDERELAFPVQDRTPAPAMTTILNTYRTCTVQTFGRARTKLGRAAGRDLLPPRGLCEPRVSV